MGDQAKNVIIGVFVLAACAVVIFALLFLHPSIGNEAQVLYVRFVDIDKISKGTRVTYAGKPIGEVGEIIDKDANGLPIRDIVDNQIYSYELKLLIDSHTQVYASDDITLRTSGLLGERSVTIVPNPPPPGRPEYLLTDKDIIYATSAGSVEDALKELKNVGEKIDDTLAAVSDAFHELKTQHFWENLGSSVRNITDITHALNKPEKWTSILNNANETAINARDFTASANKIVDHIAAGEGTLGKIVENDDLYLRLTSILNKGETVMDDINHYGLLFSLDKGWQRLRARRMNLLAKLSTPQEFRNYFNDEIDEISTSLSRVSMVLNQTEQAYPCGLVDNRNFVKVFAELLRRVSGIEEDLKMYNEQLQDCNVKKTELTQFSTGYCR